MQQVIIDEVKKLLIEAGVTGEIVLSTPPRPEMGDAAFPCFALAKEQKASPWKVVFEHLLIASIVIVLTHQIGDWISARFGS